MTAQTETHKAGSFTYSLISTGHSHNKFGSCEVCGGKPSETFHQIEARLFEFDGCLRETRHGCRDLFGHRECLEGARQ